MTRPCGNDSCCSSTNIADESSYGSGYLDNYGFWEHPCFVCARHYEQYPNEAWPHIGQVIPPMKRVPCPECKKSVVEDSLFGGVCEDCYDDVIHQMFGDF
jgi:hypothetical protein